MRPFERNNLNNFIAGWYLDADICDRIVENYDDLKSKGHEHDIKHQDYGYHSVSFRQLDINLRNLYVQDLLKVTERYKKQYRWCSDGQNSWAMITEPNLQRYDPGNYYKIWHSENTGYPGDFHRHLVFMTYLNDVSIGGETEFFYQNLKIKPEKGLTLIWPSAWTHTHIGSPALQEQKYIITGWYSYDIYFWKSPH